MLDIGVVDDRDGGDFLVSERDTKLRAQGITGQDTISAWLRGTIRTLAAEAGRPVQDAPPAPAPPVKKARKPPRRAK